MAKPSSNSILKFSMRLSLLTVCLRLKIRNMRNFWKLCVNVDRTVLFSFALTRRPAAAS
ncbi:hypothetical protein D3C72_2553240 [compost metagenome]